MVSREKLIEWLDDELDIQHFMDAGDKFNGALVRGADTVDRVGLCTNTTFENIETARENGCDFVISHHGGWEQFDQDLLDDKKQKMQEYDLTWYIAHAPLDCADSYGVAASLAEKLGIAIDGAYAHYEGGKAGRYGHLKVSEEEFLDRLDTIDDYDVVGELGDLEDAQIGVIGGSAGAFVEMLQETAEIGCDILVTGNSSFAGDIYAYEKGLTLVTLEETSSERWGVYALGERVEDRFIDIETVRLQERNW